VTLRPTTRYARSGDVSIAYQVVGEGPFDLVFVPGAVSHVDLIWDDPVRAAWFGRLASFSRLIVLDKRGTGASDPAPIADLETRIDDVRAVMDAAGSARAAVMGVSEGGPMSLLFAATHPERVAALVLYGALPRFAWAPDFPWGQPVEEWRRELEQEVRDWGTVEGIRAYWPDTTDEDAERLARAERLSASPSAYRRIEEMNMAIDVREILPSISVPTLVLHRVGDGLPIAGARWMAERIPGAQLVELEGREHMIARGDWRAVVDAVEAFLTGVRERDEWDEPEHERVLTTVLFTDMVGSTARAAELGDRAFSELVAEHHRRIRARLARFHGRELDTAGDGFFASFDGPARAIRCAAAITEDLGDLGVPIRVGIHTGECEVVDGKVAGIAVSIGARVAAAADGGEILVSQTVRDLVTGSGLAFDDRGVHELKGVPGEWRLYALRR
jgi:pimeloyl-ACP methyl ester carboxylesterase